MLWVAFILIAIACALAGFFSGLAFKEHTYMQQQVNRQARQEAERMVHAQQMKELLRQRQSLQGRLDHLEPLVRSLDRTLARERQAFQRLRDSMRARIQQLEFGTVAFSQATAPGFSADTGEQAVKLPAVEAPSVSEDDPPRSSPETTVVDPADVVGVRSVSMSERRTLQEGKALARISTSPLDEPLSVLVNGDGHRSVVVSDEMGFVVVGAGHDQEGLAALCGLLADVRARAFEILGVGRVRRITLEHEHDVSVSVCADDDLDIKLTIATVTTGPIRETATLLQTLVAIQKTMKDGPELLAGPTV